MKAPILTVITVCTVAAIASAQPGLEGKRILIAYFSKTGNTEEVARGIRKNTGGDLFRIETVKPYPADYSATTEVAKKEQKAKARPALKGTLPDMAAYDVIFLGYPNWWGTMPMGVFTFLESSDFSGKTLVPFCTHEGSRLGSSVEDIKKLAPRATVLEGLAVRGRDAKKSGSAVNSWIQGLKLPGGRK